MQLKEYKILSLILLIGLSFNLNAQEKDNAGQVQDSVFANYLLINSLKPKKKIQLKDSGPYGLAYIEPVKDSLKAENIYLLSGNIRTLDATTLEFDIRNEAIEQNFKDGSIISTQNDYSSFYYSGNQAPRTVNINAIQYIDYSSPTRTVLHSIGLSTMFVGAATTLVLAPILNYNFKFKNGNFNGSGYKNIAKAGIIVFAAGIPINLLTKIKRYNIADKQKQDQEFWYLEKIENITE